MFLRPLQYIKSIRSHHRLLVPSRRSLTQSWERKYNLIEIERLPFREPTSPTPPTPPTLPHPANPQCTKNVNKLLG